MVSGEEAFKLYDTFGLPLDIAKDVAREHGFTVDEDGFQAALAAQRQRARSSARFGLDVSADVYRSLGLPGHALPGLRFTGRRRHDHRLDQER